MGCALIGAATLASWCACLLSDHPDRLVRRSITAMPSGGHAAGEVVYLLGAGASVDAGLPNASGLTKITLDLINGVSGKVVETRALNHVIETLQMAEVRLGGRADELPDIELVVSAVELLGDRLNVELTPFVSTWDPYIAVVEMMDRQQTWGGVECVGARSDRASLAQAATGIHEYSRYRDLHLLLLRALKVALQLPTGRNLTYLDPLVATGRDHSVTVATLNYDLAVETAASRAGVPSSTGLGDWRSTGELRWPDSGLRLLKLHGSIDWDRSVEFPDDGVLGLPQEVPGPDGPEALPFVVYGRREKLRAQGPFLDLRAELVSSLRSARYLVVVGYGFRDDHVNEVVRRWINTDADRRLIVVDPVFPANWAHATNFTHFLLAGLWRQEGALLRAISQSRLGVVRETAATAFARVTAGPTELESIIAETVTADR